MSNVPAFNQIPYFDDFDATKNFLRILFRPGIAVQARELTQLQTILQNQIGDFADHIFENGAMVIPGETKLDRNYAYIKFASSLARSEDSAYIGGTITNSGGTLTADIVNVIRAEGGDPDTLYIEYKNSDSSNQSPTFNIDEQLTITLSDLSIENITVENAVDAIGEGVAVHINPGIYYLDAQFITVIQQTLVISKYEDIDNVAEISVGLKVTPEFVTPEQDGSLLDNATGSTNELAPGAHRFKISSELVNKDDVGDPTQFIELIKIQNGIVVYKVRTTDLSLIEETLARRTFDESGDYVVNDFLLDIREHLNDGSNRGIFTVAQGGDEAKLALILDPGKAFVRGFEVETIAPTVLSTDKARETANEDELLIPLQLGNYFIVEVSNKIPDLYTKVFLREGTTVIGSAFVRAYTNDPASGKLRIYLFKISIDTPAKSIADVTIVVDNDILPSVVFNATIALESKNGLGDTVLLRTSDNITLFNLPRGVVANVNEVEFAFYSQSTVTVNGTTITLTTTSGKQFRNGETNYLVETQSGVVGNPLTVDVDAGSGNTIVELEVSNLGAADAESARVIAIIENKNPVEKTKALTNRTNIIAAIDPQTIITLTESDVFRINSILGDNGLDYTNYYDFDNGQRDNFYDLGQLILKPEFSEPGVELTIDYDYFVHTAGDYFVAQSYATIDFDEIPTYTSVAGVEFKLSNAVDFRPKINATQDGFDGNPVQFVADSQGEATFDYYLSRIDKIALDKKGIFKVIKGVASINPETPPSLQDSITLYELFIPEFTFKPSDVTVNKVDHRRFTMRDIGELEKRITNLEYYTLLSLLEVDTLNKEFVDKFKNGFIVDNFESQEVGANTNNNHRIAIDFDEAEARPEASTKAVNLELNVLNSTDYQLTGDLITLPYTEISTVSQPLASRVSRLNPFVKFSYDGRITLNPTTDYWVSTLRRPDLTLDNGIFESAEFRDAQNSLGTIWNNWQAVWRGTPRTRTSSRRVSGRRLTTTTTTRQQREIRTGIERRGITRTQIENLGDFILSTSAIPFIRSRLVNFTATGMKPNTKVFPFFDDVDVSAHVIPNPLITDGLGSITGTFTIPNQDDIRFRTGVRKLLLTDSESNSDSSTTADGNYLASGVLQERQQQFISTRIVDLDVRSVSQDRTRNVVLRRSSRWSDPLAQSFLIDNDGGAFITSIDIYFGTSAATNSDGVTCQIRNMINGYPAPEIIPFGEVTLDSASIGVGSEDATVVTKFTFPSPVFLEEDKEYCFVLLTNSEVLDVWSSKLGERSRLPGDTTENTGQQISKQAFLGSLFKSQNNSTWTAVQTEDIKFNINRAVFDTSLTGQLEFNNQINPGDVDTESDPFHQFLQINPFETETGSNVVKVNHINHSFKATDLVTFTSTNIGAGVNGIPTVELIGTPLTVIDHPNTLDAVDVDYYYVQVTANATSTGFGGADDINASQYIVYTTAYFLIEEIKLNGTSVDWSFKGHDKATDTLDTIPFSIESNKNIFLPYARVIKEDADQRLQTFASLTSTRDNISPVIDTQRVALLATENRVNNKQDVDLVANASNSAARYILKTVQLVNASNELRIIFDANRPSNTFIDVYYKAQTSDSDLAFDQEIWNEIILPESVPVNEDYNDFSEYEYSVFTGIDFVNLSVKVVLRSSNEAKVPRLKDLRIIALKDVAEL